MSKAESDKETTHTAKPHGKGGSSGYVCAKCGLPVTLWHYGWKHSSGHGSPKSCGEKPQPVMAPKGNL